MVKKQIQPILIQITKNISQYESVIIVFDNKCNFRNRKMLYFQRQELQSQLALNTFKDQIFHKTLLVQQLVYEFQRIGEKQELAKTTALYIKLSRKTIQEIDAIIAGAKNYLIQLNLETFYNLIYKMFKALIVSFNCISTNFIRTIKAKKKRNVTEQNQRQQHSQSLKFIHPLKNKNQTKQLEYFDYLIKGLEEKEIRLAEKKGIIEKELLQQEQYIATISASDTVNQLDNLCVDLQRIINNSDKISGENVIYRHQELNKRIYQLKLPTEIENEYCKSITDSTRQTFIATMTRILREQYNSIKQFERKQLLAEIQAKKPIMCATGVQTETDSKIKQIDQLQRQKRIILAQNQNIKKSNTFLQNENQKMLDKFRQMKQSIRNLEKACEEANSTIRKSAAQFGAEKQNFQETLKKKDEQIQLLQKAYPNINFNSSMQKQAVEQIFRQTFPNFNIIEQTDNNALCKEDDTFGFKSILREKANNSSYVDRQLQSMKKQNMILRKCLHNIISKLTSLGIIQEKQETQNGAGLKIAFINQKLDSIIDKISSLMVNNSQPILGELERTSLRRNRLELQQINLQNTKRVSQFQTKSTQTDETSKMIQMQVQSGNNKNERLSEQKNSKLDALKEQFLKKVVRKNKQKVFISSKKKRQQPTEQGWSRTQNTNTTVSYTKTQCMEQPQPESRAGNRTKYPYERLKKESSFEQFRIAQNTGQHKKQNERIKHSKFKIAQNENPIRQRKYIEQKQHNKPNICIQNIQVLKEVRPIIQMIESKNDSRDYYLNTFVRGLFNQFLRIRGRNFLEDLLAKELDSILVKVNKCEDRQPSRHHIIHEK